MSEVKVDKNYCTHCGEECRYSSQKVEDFWFCCEGCKMVYGLLDKSGLCTYYSLNNMPGISQKDKSEKNKFLFLDTPEIADKLIVFQDDKYIRVNFYLPQMHCSSCLYLLERLPKLHDGVAESKVHFIKKEVHIIIYRDKISLRALADLLSDIGYEPYISLQDLKGTRPGIDKSLIYRLGVAGFCFSNIMLLSFPDYLGIDATEERIRTIFRWTSLLLSLPVVFYAAYPFYESSWKSLKHRFLNIDAPIALAVIITFVRSLYELSIGEGGYFDSMSGIVFFMLIGRVLQDKTYRQLSFDRDYKAYFPVSVTRIINGIAQTTALPDIEVNDTLRLHNNELIPVDGIITRGHACIDYSYVTGEAVPVIRRIGDLVYAGGKQTGGNLEILTTKEVSQSYLTSLWNKSSGKADVKEQSFVHNMSKYFTIVVLIIATVTGIYWRINNPENIWPAVTAIFIIACPCALLLANSFTNGHMLRIFSANNCYLKNAHVIEALSKINHIVFDKTGTLTESNNMQVSYKGPELSDKHKLAIAGLAASSTHPLSKAIAKYLDLRDLPEVSAFKELPGIGIEGYVDDIWIKLGANPDIDENARRKTTEVQLSMDGSYFGMFTFQNSYRTFVPELFASIKPAYKISAISGDNNGENERLRKMMGNEATLLFNQKPHDKKGYIQCLKAKGDQVMMIGDGLNDAGALTESNVGVAVSELTNNFTPASDIIISSSSLGNLTKFIQLSKINRKIVNAAFAMSVIYNVAGLYFAVQGVLSPLIAAILMPASSLSIILLTYLASRISAKQLKLAI